NGQRAGAAFALVGVSRPGGVSRWAANLCVERTALERSYDFYDWHEPQEKWSAAGQLAATRGCSAQRACHGRLLAAYVGGGRRDRCCGGLDGDAVGSRPWAHHC